MKNTNKHNKSTAKSLEKVHMTRSRSKSLQEKVLRNGEDVTRKHGDLNTNHITRSTTQKLPGPPNWYAREIENNIGYLRYIRSKRNKRSLYKRWIQTGIFGSINMVLASVRYPS